MFSFDGAEIPWLLVALVLVVIMIMLLLRILHRYLIPSVQIAERLRTQCTMPMRAHTLVLIHTYVCI